jgi:hypothetical protein
MDAAEITAVLTDPVTVELVERATLMRVAYTGRDGAPRVVPVGYLLRDGRFTFCTTPISAKTAALRADPRVAITVDTADPLCCLFVRGTAEVEVVPGVPDDYLEYSLRTMPAEQHAGFEAQVRGLYDEMARIVITPTFARLNDFQRTAPRAIERLMAAKQA